MNPITQLTHYFIVFFSLFLIYIILVIFIYKKKIPWKKTLFIVLFIPGLLLRVILFFQEPLLSDDIYRYYFDGKVLSHGINPYDFPPNSKELAFLQDEYSKKINHPHMHTVYPPLAQVLFFLGYQTKNNIYGIKLILALFDIGILILLFYLLKHTALSLYQIFIYALNPLIIFEFYGSCHTEPAVAFFLLLGAFLISKNKKINSFFSILGAVLVKYYGILIIPFFRKMIRWSHILIYLLILGGFFALFYSQTMFKSLFFYQQNFEFNGFLYQHLKLLFPMAVARYFCFGILIISLILIYIKNEKLKKMTVENYTYLILIVLTVFLFTVPTFHPWYFTLVIPFLCFHPKLSLILFSGLVFASYQILFTRASKGVWKENYLILLVEYVPFFIFFTIEYSRLRKRSHPLYF